MDNIYKKIEKYSPNKEWKMLIVNMIADMFNNIKFNPIVTELFIRNKKLNISFAFITESYFAVPKFRKTFQLNSTHYFVIKIQNKGALQWIAFNTSSNIDFKDFRNIEKSKSALQNRILL